MTRQNPRWPQVAVLVAVLAAIAVWFSQRDDVDRGPATAADAGAARVASPRNDAVPVTGTLPASPDPALAVSASGRSDDAGVALARPPDGGDPGADAAARARVQARFDQNARAASELVDTFCAESERLRASGFPRADGPRNRDAWPYMSVRIDWEGQVRPPGLLHLSSPLRQRLREYGADWPARIRDYDLDGLDFAWMTELQQFDHWDVLRDMRSVDPRGSNFFTAAIPNFVDLVSWTKLRWARAFAVGDSAAASADVRHLAVLLRTTGLLVADMQALRMLQLEREAHAFATAQGRPTGAWQPLPAEELDRYRRVVRSSPEFFAPGVSEATMQRAYECNGAARCSAIFEGVGLHTSAGHLARNDTTDQIDALANRSGCDPRTLEWLRQTPALAEGEVAGYFDGIESPLELLRADGGT